MNLEQEIINVILGFSLVGKEEVSLETNLKTDLGFDSLDSVELIVDLERKFDIVIKDAEAEEARTVKDIVELVRKQVKEV